MSNPITPTVVNKLVTTDTTASSLVVGGASPTATTGTGGVNAGTVVGNTSVSDPVGTMATIRAGGIGIASQAANDMVYASSATQLARVANGTTGQVWTATTSGAPSWQTRTAGMVFVGYNTKTAGSSFTIKSGGDLNYAVDLATDLNYQIILEVDPGSGFDDMVMAINSLPSGSTANYSYGITTIDQAATVGAVAGAGTSNGFFVGATSAARNYKVFYANIRIGYANGFPHVQWDGLATKDNTNDHNFMASNGKGIFDSATNATQFAFASGAGSVTYNWRVWLFKSSQS